MIYFMYITATITSKVLPNMSFHLSLSLCLCSELIQKYRQKVVECEQFKQQLKEVQTKLSIEEKGRKGLVAELNILHKVHTCIHVHVLVHTHTGHLFVS